MSSGADPIVLIVEDEPVLRSSMVRGLSKELGIDVADAATVDEARRLMRELHPSLIISDLDLPDGTGLDVLHYADRLGYEPSIIFASAYIPKYRHLIPRRDLIEVREKPIPLAELRSLARERLSSGRRLPEGEESVFSPADYIQLACMCRRSVEVIIKKGGVAMARILIRDGELWSAEDSLGRGEEVFDRVLHVPSLSVSCGPFRGDWGPRSVESSWQNILLESARRHDEDSRYELKTSDLESLGEELETFGETPAPSAPPARADAPPPASSAEEFEYQKAERRRQEYLEARAAIPPSEDVRPRSRLGAEAEFKRLVEEAVDALLRKNYALAFERFSAANALQPGDAHVVANLTRLSQLGVTHG